MKNVLFICLYVSSFVSALVLCRRCHCRPLCVHYCARIARLLLLINNHSTDLSECLSHCGPHITAHTHPNRKTCCLCCKLLSRPVLLSHFFVSHIAKTFSMIYVSTQAFETLVKSLFFVVSSVCLIPECKFSDNLDQKSIYRLSRTWSPIIRLIHKVFLYFCLDLHIMC